MDRTELLCSFIEIADDLLANPWCARQSAIALAYQADEEGEAGTLRLVGPDEMELKSLLLDLRPLIQPRSEQYLPIVIRTLAEAVPDPSAQLAAATIQAGFERTTERGLTEVDGERVSPDRIARLWLYGRYHHRDLSKRRQLAALHPMLRLASRVEFLLYLQGVLSTVVDCCNFVTESKELGYLGDVPLARFARPEG